MPIANPKMTVLVTRAQAETAKALLRLDPQTWADLAPHLTCTEADAFAEFLDEWGSGHERGVLMDAHAAADDEGDEHYAEERQS